MRQRFGIIAIRASEEGLRIIHDTYFAAAQAKLSNLQFFFTSLALMPVAKKFFEAGAKNGGNPMGVSISDAPYIWVETSITWASPADDGVIHEFATSVIADTNARLGELGGVVSQFLYLNDAHDNQPVFEGYPPENLRWLKRVRAKYDPTMIFTDLMPGGWKVAHA
jgi:hypothetical protein